VWSRANSHHEAIAASQNRMLRVRGSRTSMSMSKGLKT
jgi:hypothetical protein